MEQMKKTTSAIAVNQVDGVLQDYLDQLLITATSDAAAVELKYKAPQPEVPELPLVEEPELDVETTVTATELRSINWRDSQGIECLIFKVAGLKLAIPLSLLGGVYPVTAKVTPLFGQAKWSLGVWAGEDIKLTIIDSAQLMMPERNTSLRDDGYEFFIQLDRSPWALACQEICDTVTLGYDAIKWRGSNSKRPWLAGTVIDEMCALVDVPEILRLLETQRHTLA